LLGHGGAGAPLLLACRRWGISLLGRLPPVDAWLVPTRIIAVLPLAYIALRTRDVRVGIVAHVLLNTADLILLLVHLGTR
jgi:hypothetical protein